MTSADICGTSLRRTDLPYRNERRDHASWPKQGRSQPHEPIPQNPYRTWSLFLINNPQWLVTESNEKVKSLYDQFEAFGEAIGPNQVAVWFWSGKTQRDVDVARSVEFCEKLKLPPSGGPYILVTSDYPGKGLMSDPSSLLPTPLKSYYTVSLNNKRCRRDHATSDPYRRQGNRRPPR